MRRLRCAAVVVVVAASLFCSAISSYAGPSPSPAPSAPLAGKPATETELAKRFAKAHPAPKKVVIPRELAAPNRPAKVTIPENYSGPVKRLLTDLKAGDLSKKRAARTAKQMLRALTGRASGLSARYSGLLTSEDLVAVSLLAGTGYQSSLLPIGTDTTASPSQRAMPQGALSQPSCALENNLETCTVNGEHASVVYVPSRLTTTQLADDSPADGVPDKAAKTVEALDSAWDYYHDVLGYTGPSSGKVWWGWNVIQLVNDRAASLPGGIVVAPDTDDVSYLAAHELFHQFQWPYMAAAFPLPSPIPPGSITDPVALADVLTLMHAALNLSKINWWMESTAEWASTRYANFISQPGQDPRTDIASLAAGSLGLFFETPPQKLAQGNPLTDSRQYGELSVVEYFAQTLEDQFVRKTFETMQGWLFLDGHSQIDNTLTDDYGYTTADLLPWMWHAQYLLCDPANHEYGQGRLNGWWINPWCTHVVSRNGLSNPNPPAGDVARPAHDATSLDSSSAAHRVSAGGAWFSDIAGSSEGLAGQILAVEISSTIPEQTSVWLDTWADTPGVWCSGSQVWLDDTGSGPSYTEISLDPACPNATLSVVNTSLSGGDISIESQMRVLDSWAVISNGTLALSVSAYGALRLGYTQPPGEEPQPVAFTHLASGIDALAGATYNDCWGVGRTDEDEDGDWALQGAFSCGPDIYGQPVGLELVSFVHTATDATAIVRVGTADLVQYFHPSANANAYQLDITVRTDETTPWGDSDPDHKLTYRRVMDAYMPETSGRLDDYVTISHQPADTAVTANTNRTWSGSTRAEVYQWMEPAAPASSLEDWESFHQGFALDLTLPGFGTGGQSAPVPQATLYYGAASHSDIGEVVQSIGAKTYGLVTPPAAYNTDPAVTFFLAH